MVFKISMESVNDKVFYMKVYSKIIASPLLLCDQ